MAVPDVYGAIDQTRVTIGVINTWTAVAIPVGARNAMLQLEDQTATGRVSTDPLISPTTEGGVLLPGTAMTIAGTAAAVVTLYVASDKLTSAILIYTLDQ
jgi:hypothetical protein